MASLFLLPNTMSYLLAGRLCAATLCRVPRRPMSCKMSLLPFCHSRSIRSQKQRREHNIFNKLMLYTKSVQNMFTSDHAFFLRFAIIIY